MLKFVSLLTFVFGIFVFLIAQVIDIVPSNYDVRNSEYKVIGHVQIPHDYYADQLVSFSFMILSGIQYWAVRNSEKKKQTSADESL